MQAITGKDIARLSVSINGAVIAPAQHLAPVGTFIRGSGTMCFCIGFFGSANLKHYRHPNDCYYAEAEATVIFASSKSVSAVSGGAEMQLFIKTLTGKTFCIYAATYCTIEVCTAWYYRM